VAAPLQIELTSVATRVGGVPASTSQIRDKRWAIPATDVPEPATQATVERERSLDIPESEVH